MSTASSSEPLALIAGSTQMPCVVAGEARARGRAVTAIAIRGVTDCSIDDAVDAVHWLDWGDVSGFLALLGKLSGEGIREAVMAGKVEQQRIYDEGARQGGLRGVLSTVQTRHTDSLIEAVVNLMSGAGIELLECTDYLQDHLARRGVLSGRRPDEREQQDIVHGWQVAKQLGALDIGQSVVIKDRAVVAIEAMEGTDACLRRAGELAGAGTVLVKVGKPGQDLRFDVPVVGVSTVETMAEVGASALCIEADLTVVFDRPEFQSQADAAGIAVVARQQA